MRQRPGSDKLTPRTRSRASSCRSSSASYLHRETRKGGYASYDVRSRAPSDMSGVADGNAQVRLPPPPAFVVDAERREQARADERRAELEAAGADVSSIPPDQLAAGAGPVISSRTELGAPLRRMAQERPGRPRGQVRGDAGSDIEVARGGALADLAPATVLPDHLAKNCAYSMPTTAAALRELGVRFGAGADDLAALIDRAGRELAVRRRVGERRHGRDDRAARGPRSFAAWPLAVEKPSKAVRTSSARRVGIVTPRHRRRAAPG